MVIDPIAGMVSSLDMAHPSSKCCLGGDGPKVALRGVAAIQRVAGQGRGQRWKIQESPSKRVNGVLVTDDSWRFMIINDGYQLSPMVLND